MVPGKAKSLRIYCICGQKMKVSASMYGNPGKCVACRQKIRIPRQDEIPPGARDIYLKEHPEFLRKVEGRPARRAPEAEAAPEPIGAMALDVLEPLQLLCSLDHKLERELERLEKGDGRGGTVQTEDDRAELLGHRTRVRLARAELDEQIRQRLMEAAIELASVHEKIAAATLSVRVGETDFAAFHDVVERLRRRRDILERRQQNLRGWLGTRDPSVAGGYFDVSLERLSTATGFRLQFASEHDQAQSLVDGGIESLRNALLRHEQAERKLAEAQRLRAAGTPPVSTLKDYAADARAEKQQAAADVAFCRGRLDQLQRDYSGDLESVSAQLDLARGRLQVGESDRPRFDKIERELLQAKSDVAKALDLIKRALSAGSVQDVPRAKGTFLERLARPLGARGPQLDSWLAWGAGLGIMLAFALPSVGGLSLMGAAYRSAAESLAGWALVFGGVLVAVLVAAAALVPSRVLRGSLLLGLWFVSFLAAYAVVHEAQYGLGSLASRFREGGWWLIRPGVLLLVLSSIAVLAAAFIALLPEKRVRPFLVIAPAMALVGLAAVAADFGGLLLPKPYVRVEYHLSPGSAAATYDTSVIVGNRGRRSLIVTSSRSDGRNAYLFLLEQQIGQESWREVPRPSGEESTARQAPPAGSVVFQYTLATGSYRALLTSAALDQRIEERFVLPVPAQPPQAVSSAREEAAAVSEPTPAQVEPQPPAPSGPAEPDPGPHLGAELRGVMLSAENEPTFSISLYLPDGTTRQRTLSVGNVVYDPWNLTEYNPAERTVTLSDGGRIFILRRGERITLPLAR